MTDELLYESELQVLTLRAPFVHEHADRPYFVKEINDVATKLNEQPFLNYFVRYRVNKDDPSQHRWSRIRKVIFLSERDKYSEPQASAQSGTNDASADATRASHTHGSSGTGLSITVPPTSSAHSHYFTWRNKTFWVALLVEGESSPVYLPRLSGKLPTPEEVMAFCVHQANHNPQERYTDEPTMDLAEAEHADHNEYAGQDTTAEGEGEEHKEGGVETRAEGDANTGDAMPHYTHNYDNAEGYNTNNDYAYEGYDENVNNTGTYHGEEGADNNYYSPYTYDDTTTSESPRSYLPTSQQIAKLRDYRQQHLVQHQWTSEEVQEAKELNARYSQAGVAATPVRATHVHLHNMQLETEIGLTAGSAANLPPRRLPRLPASPQLSQSLFVPAASVASRSGETEAQPQTSTSAEASPGVAHSASETGGSFSVGSPIATPLSPFLPRRLQRQFAVAMQQPSVSSVSGSPHEPSRPDETTTAAATSSAFATPAPSQETVSAFLTAADATPRRGPGGTPATAAGALDDRVTRQWAEAAEQEQAFYQYVSNAQRSEYLNKLAAITRRNSEENKRNRLRGIENERRLKRQGNLLESGGLWVTDDRERARKAALYKASLEGTDSASTTRAQNAPRKEETAQSSQTHDAEEAFLRHFREMHSAQTLNFSAVPDDLLDDFGGVDTTAPSHPEARNVSSVPQQKARTSAASLNDMPLEADELENATRGDDDDGDAPIESGDTRETSGSPTSVGLDPTTAALLSRTPYRLVRSAPGADSAMLLQSQLLHVSAAHMARRRLRSNADESEGGSGAVTEKTASEPASSFAASAQEEEGSSVSDVKRRRVES